MQPPAPPATPPAPVPAAPAAPAAAPANDSNLITVKSPMIGTFYRTAGPDKPAFVEVGTDIKKGDTIREPKHLKNGESYLQAWYKTNIAIKDHQDRWATFIREGSKIVLYSAQSGNSPKYTPRGTPVLLSDDVTIDNILLDEWSSATRFDRSFQTRASLKKLKPFLKKKNTPHKQDTTSNKMKRIAL